MMQNSDNIIVADPLQQVAFGSEYINTLMFDPGNTTLMRGVTITAGRPGGGNSGSGAFSFAALAGLLLLAAARRRA